MGDRDDEGPGTPIHRGGPQAVPPTVEDADVRANPGETAQEAVHQVMLRRDVPPSSRWAPLREVARRSAPMAEAPREASASRASHRSIAPRPRWVQEIDAAVLRWDRLSASELGDTRGRAHSLAVLVEERYAISREAADAEVAGFFEACDAAGPTPA